MPTASPRSNFLAKLAPGARCLFTAWWCPEPTIRTVVEVRSKDASFSHPTKSEPSWLTFPKASEVTEPTPGKFIITYTECPGRPLTYDFNVAP